MLNNPDSGGSWKRDKTIEMNLCLPRSMMKEIDERRGLSTRTGYILRLLDGAFRKPRPKSSVKRTRATLRTLRKAELV